MAAKPSKQVDSARRFNPRSREIKLSRLDLPVIAAVDQNPPAAVLYPVSLLVSLCVVRPPVVRRIGQSATTDQRYLVVANADCIRLARQSQGATAGPELKLRCIEVDDTWTDADWRLLETQLAPYLFGELSTRDQHEARRQLSSSPFDSVLKKPSVREGLAPILRTPPKNRPKDSKKDVEDDG